ncbi:hypothetical protein BSX36_06290 [Listeria monocytogenes]|uniref:Uncharacterized protein n=2 Tax=Listeria monocytogenes TaxID=1639 RepID=A0A0E0USQ4_LISMM|nr:conserved hypothetical protein [Listeria monocytogenes HCC23]AEH91467.1 hypothetical protein LMM7_0461 [Listeria monocytogenes M7]AKS53048.1 hypothetical protein LM850658_02115 [Listeria monocytogenes]CAR83148.1 hypothetical protein lmo4a_0446 [Listeria monocytogenes L99]EAC6861419.1 hypothetical protein [Listeria monocytogenes]
MEKMTLKKKTYANFNKEFAKVFNSDNSLPENIFNTKFHNFFVYDMDYFYEETGWEWILQISSNNKVKNLFFTSATEKNSDYTIAEIPTSLNPKQILEQMDILENESEDKKNTFFLTFNEACLFSNVSNWGLYFVNEFNFVILALEEDFPEQNAFSHLESMTKEEFTKHFQEWSVWLEKDNLNFLKEFNEVFFAKS